jgi:hypothetical protein
MPAQVAATWAPGNDFSKKRARAVLTYSWDAVDSVSAGASQIHEHSHVATTARCRLRFVTLLPENPCARKFRWLRLQSGSLRLEGHDLRDERVKVSNQVCTASFDDDDQLG